RIAVRLKGQPPNTRGIGGRIQVSGGAVPVQTQEIQSGGRYLSSDEPMRVFAAGSLTNSLTVEVFWRSRKYSVLPGIKANQLVEMTDPAVASEPPPAKPKSSQPVFEAVSELLAHPHHEEEFDDFSRQPLLPKKLSQLGPGVAWFDIDHDGWDDLIIGS